MLVVTVDLVPAGCERHRRTIGSMRIANVSNRSDLCDYDVEAMEGANPLTGTPQRNAICTVRAHDRRRSIWALLAKASEEIIKADFDEF